METLGLQNVMQKRGDYLKKGAWTVCKFKEGLGKKEGGGGDVFERRLIPQWTLCPLNYPKKLFPPLHHCFDRKMQICNLHAVFGHFAKIVPHQAITFGKPWSNTLACIACRDINSLTMLSLPNMPHISIFKYLLP